jgi:hypothetical protein
MVENQDVQKLVRRGSSFWQENPEVSIKINVNEIMSRNADCCICFEPFREPTLTPCGHTFCAECIAEIVNRTHNCPVCKREDIQQD